VEVRLDGVDLIAALGLASPFSGQSGPVSIASGVVIVSDFSFLAPPGGVAALSLQVTGLVAGDHDLQVKGMRRNNGTLHSDTAHFAVLGDVFAQRSRALTASGRANGAEMTPQKGTVLQGATLAEPFAAPPVRFPGGGELRPGFVPVAEAHAAGGSP
jgi:hypothetical protein